MKWFKNVLGELKQINNRLKNNGVILDRIGGKLGLIDNRLSGIEKSLSRIEGHSAAAKCSVGIVADKISSIKPGSSIKNLEKDVKHIREYLKQKR